MKTIPSGTLLLILGPKLLRGLGQDGPLSDEANMHAGELLFKLTDDLRLKLLPALELRRRHVDQDGLFATGSVEFFRTRDVELTNLGLHVGILLQLKKSLKDTKHITVSKQLNVQNKAKRKSKTLTRETLDSNSSTFSPGFFTILAVVEYILTVERRGCLKKVEETKRLPPNVQSNNKKAEGEEEKHAHLTSRATAKERG